MASSKSPASAVVQSSIWSQESLGAPASTSLRLAWEKLYLHRCRRSMAWKRVMSLEAAAADMWRLGCFRVLASSTARANVPTDLETQVNIMRKLWK